MSEQTPPPEHDPYGTPPAGGGAGDSSPPPPPGEGYPPPQGGTPPPPPPYAEQPGYGGQQGYGGYGTPTNGPRPGELMDRFLARLIDYVLLLVVALVVNLVLLAGIFGLQRGGMGLGGSYAYAAVSAVITTLIYLGYFGYMESSQGKTLGKMAMKLHVEKEAGGKPTLEEAVKRNIWMALPLLGVIPILGGLVAALGQIVAVILIAVGINSDTLRRRPWTDKFAGTQVIKEG